MTHLNNLNNGNRSQDSLYTACIGLLWLTNKVAQSRRYLRLKTLRQVACYVNALKIVNYASSSLIYYDSVVPIL